MILRTIATSGIVELGGCKLHPNIKRVSLSLQNGKETLCLIDKSFEPFSIETFLRLASVYALCDLKYFIASTWSTFALYRTEGKYKVYSF